MPKSCLTITLRTGQTGVLAGWLSGEDRIESLPLTSPVELITEINFSMSLEQMVAAGNYDRKDNAITAERFPVEGAGTKRFRNKLFHFGRSISSEVAVAAMQKEKFTPGSHVHGLAFGAAFPDVQRKCSIACLGSSAQVDGRRSIVCLLRRDAGRSLFLGGWESGWHGRWRLLGVREISGA